MYCTFHTLNFSEISTLPVNFPNSKDPAPISKMLKMNTGGVSLNRQICRNDPVKTKLSFNEVLTNEI